MTLVLQPIPFPSSTPHHDMDALPHPKLLANPHQPTTSVPSTKALTQSNKSEFVEGLVDTALLVIQSIWGETSPGTETTRTLPLRVFIRETLRRSRTSYSTLQTALFYLFRVKALRDSQAQKFEATPTEYQTKTKNIMKRAHDAGKMTLPPSPTPSSPSTSLSPCSPPSPSPITCPPSPEPERPSKRVRLERMSKPKMDEPSTFTSDSARRGTQFESPKPKASTLTSDSAKPDDPTQCGRRMFLASLISAAKYLQDRNYSNRAWSKVTGLSVEEINRNEMSFLRLVDYRLFVSPTLFRRWSALLLGHVNSLRKSSSPDGCLVGGSASFLLRPPAAVV